MNDCIFCKIIAGEIPAAKIYEDDKVFAFLDIKPNNPGHTLVLPKKHFKNLMETDSDDLQAVISVIPKLAKAIMQAYDYQGFNLVTNNGKVAGQVIDHLHFHIIPRREGDGHKFFEGRDYEGETIDEVAEKIKKFI